MRRAGALAAAMLLAVALAAPGCNLVDSLTPFGIGHQDYSSSSANVNGNWTGTTASGGEVKFQVASGNVLAFHLVHIDAGCTRTFEDTTTVVQVVDGFFTFEIPLPQGRFVASGRFTSGSSFSGSYSFEGLPAGACPNAASASFTALKSFL
jgi:hypothetical protein